jgi:hypothetical protein
MDWKAQALPDYLRRRYSSRGVGESGTIDLLADEWRLNTVKVKSKFSKARLLLMRFPWGPTSAREMQLTLPIVNLRDSKATKAVVEALTCYGAHYVNNKVIRVGRDALVDK